MSTASRPDFEPVHSELKAILRRHETGSLKANPDQPGNYVLIGPPTERSKGKEVWFGAVQTKKNYVSYHLMAVYAFPELLDGISPELKKRMQGKSCFNFKAVDDRLFAELAQLTEEGYNRFKAEGLLD